MRLEELVNLVENQADELASIMVQRVRESPRMAGYHRFADEELEERARLVYANLGKWLEDGSEYLVQEEYSRLGRLRCRERIPISQVVWGLLLLRRTLWQFVEQQGWDTLSDLRGTLDLEILVVRFFDRAILHAVSGYEAEGSGPVARQHQEEASFWPGG